jgi:hypothetical protein
MTKHSFFLLMIFFIVFFIIGCGSGSDSDDSDNSDDDDDSVDDDSVDDDDDSDNDDDDDDDSTDHFQVDASNGNWSDTGVHVAYGESLSIAATGEIRIEAEGGALGPDGTGESCGLECPAPALSRGALVGKIISGQKGFDTPFLVGSSFEHLMTDAGTLFLIVNDDSYDDNEGAFEAEIEVIPVGDDDDDSGDDDDDDDLPQQCHPRNYIQQVIEIEYGTDAGNGQPFLPDSVLGPPAGEGDWAPQSDPRELISLGEGGWIIVKMGRKIEDGPGVDFIIYENLLYWGGDYTNAYTEAAVVDVSQDGETWVRFDFDFIIDGPTGPQGLPDTVPDNFIGFAGIEPTFANCDPNNDGNFDDMIDPLDPEAGGGDHFDLADTGLEWAAYIRITDTGHIERNPGSEMYDNDGDLINDGGNLLEVWDGIQGFDLDAVAVVNGGEDLEPDDL